MGKRIAFFGWNSATQYSGGRYAAWMTAEALAHGGHDVTFITNNTPLFVRDFVTFPRHRSLKVHLTQNFRTELPSQPFDLVIVVPHTQRDPSFFLNARTFACTRKARLLTLNFETPNWFNSMAPVPRDVRNYTPWKRCCQHVEMVISCAKATIPYAEEYLGGEEAGIMHVASYPAINTIVADRVQGVEREKRILLFARFYNHDAHKGSTRVGKLLCEAMRGHTIVFVVGTAEDKPEQLAEWEAEAENYGVKFEFLFKLTDEEKFREIKRSCLVLFPSFFEGYGLPPIEAQYCNVPSISFDLPVVRETSGDGVHYVPIGDWDAFRERIKHILTHGDDRDLHSGIKEIASFKDFVGRMNAIVEKAEARPRRTAVAEEV